MPLDSQIAAILAAKSAAPRHMLPIAELRNAMNSELPAKRTPVSRVEDLRIFSPDGKVPIRIYRPEGSSLGCLLFLHGGGFVMGGLDTHDHICRDLCVGSQTTVIAVDYRLAPEFPFPSALDDCETALNWAVENADYLAIDPANIVLGGDSAGGNLATVLAIRARDRGRPKLRGQVLVYPVTDAPLPFKPSYIENGSGYSLTQDDMLRFWGDYVGNCSRKNHPEVCPLRARTLADLPDALVITAEFDPLRDEGEAYARRLMECGVHTTLTRYDGAVHGFVRMGAEVRLAVNALRQICDWMKIRLKQV